MNDAGGDAARPRLSGRLRHARGSVSGLGDRLRRHVATRRRHAAAVGTLVLALLLGPAVYRFGGVLWEDAATPAITIGAAVETLPAIANLRAWPSPSARVLARIDRGTVLTPRAREGDWLRVRLADGTDGWLNVSLVHALPTAP